MQKREGLKKNKISSIGKKKQLKVSKLTGRQKRNLNVKVSFKILTYKVFTVEK